MRGKLDKSDYIISITELQKLLKTVEKMLYYKNNILYYL